MLFDFLTPLGWLPAVLFIVGFLLLCVEMFIPGFGVPGVLGIIAMVVGVILQAKTVVEAFFYLVIIIALATAAFLIISRSLRKGRLSHTLVLKDVPDANEGFRPALDYTPILNKTGVAITPLRPSGSIEIDGQKYDVTADSEFVNKGEKVRVINVSGMRVLVRRVRED